MATPDSPVPGYQCGVVPYYPKTVQYPATDNVVARASGFMECDPGPKVISYMELYVSLLRYRDGAWSTLNTNVYTAGGATTLNGQAQYDCHHQDAYLYKTTLFGYDVADDVGYAGSASRQTYLVCWP